MAAKLTADDHEQVERAIVMIKIDAFRSRKVSPLSSGECARVWLSMCMALQTKYLLLDEPLAALDVVCQVEVIKLIRQLVGQQNLGIVIILHNLNLAASFCGEFIALKQCRLCRIDAVISTTNADILRYVFGVDFSLLNHPTYNHKVAVI